MMGKCTRVLSALIWLLPMASFADMQEQKSWQDFNHHIRIGFQGTQVKGNSFQTWFDGKYNTADNKDLGGLYLGFAVGFQASRFVKYDVSGVTRGSTDMDNHSLLLGQYFRVSDSIRAAVAMGGFLSDVSRETNTSKRRNRESAAALELGLEWRPWRYLMLAPSWRAGFLPDGGLHEFRLDNRLQLTDNVSFELSGVYLKWDTVDQVSWQFGPRLAF